MPDLRKFSKSIFHKKITAYPERYVINKHKGGWDYCEACGNHYRIWITSDEEWNKLPNNVKDRRLCVKCFRLILNKKKKGFVPVIR